LNTTKLKLSELESAIVRKPLVVTLHTTVIDAIAQMASGRSQLDAEHNSDNQQAFQQEARSSCVLVIEDEQAIGILTERDVVRLSAQQQSLDLLVMREVMSTAIVAVELGALISDVQKILNQRSIRELLVVGDQGELLGIVTQTSFLQALSLREMSNLAEIQKAKALISSQQLELRRRNALLETANEELNCTVEELRVSSEELVEQHQQLEYERFRYQNLFDVAPDGYLVTDASGKILEANQFILDLLAISREYILGKPFIVFVASYHRELFYNQLNHVFPRNNVNAVNTSWEMMLIPYQGDPFPSELTVTQNIDPTTNKIQLCWIIRNISDRKRAEQELQQLNQSLEAKVEERTQELWQVNHLQRAILNGTDYAIISTDLNGIIQTFNAGAEKMLGYSKEEIIGNVTAEIFFDPQEINDKAKTVSAELGQDIGLGFRSLMRALMAMETQGISMISEEFTNIRKDGSRFPISLSVTVLKDDNDQPLGYLSVRKDISDRKQAELNLRKTTDRLALALRSGAIGCWEWDMVSNTIIWDERMYELYGVTKQADSPVVYDIWSNAVHPEDLANTNALLQIAISETIEYDAEFRVVHPDSSIHFIKAYGTILKDAQGNPESMIGINFDISALKYSEAQLLLANQELLQATRLKDEFLANMSHELRTPLNAILGITEGLMEEVFGGLNQQQKNILQTVENSGNHLLELINDILDLAKIEAGKLTLDCKVTSINQLCQSSIMFVKQQAMQKQIKLEMHVLSGILDLELDERRIRQVLINLLNNAVKFTPEGGSITLEVTLESAIDDLTDGTPTQWIRFAVIDTGIGIDPKELKKLFQPFIQIDSALNRQYDGTGLGLALVKRIVELHNGRVSVTSEVGVGSRFEVALPCIEITSQIPQEVTTPSSSASIEHVGSTSESPLILLAEDNDANIMTIVSYLEVKGFRIAVAKDGQEAIDLVRSQNPDLILMDIQMPKMDGLEAIEWIRNNHSTDMPIIALTALAMTGDREKCLAAGANDYLSKPIKLKQLATVIQQFLE
jgi:PAS domain S-box-containing protein